jgi:hypothetical protein
MAHWISAGASATGSSHFATLTPCQDASVLKTSKDGEWVVMVVSDGAGSASKAEEGSRLVADFFSDELFKLINELNRRPPGHWINDFVIEKVIQTRAALRDLAKSDDIRDYHCTLVACLAGPSGGFSIHIGDGLIVGGYKSSTNSNTPLSLFVSEPENGEYANETYFITEGDWIKHLRISPMPRMDWIFCCSDGGGALALTNDTELKIGFLEPVISDVFALNDEESRDKKLAEYLSDPLSEKVTNDDKSIILSIRSGLKPNLSDYVTRGTLRDPAPTLPADSIISPTTPTPTPTPTPTLDPKTAKTKGSKKKKFKYLLTFILAIALIILAALALSNIPSLIKIRPSEPTQKLDKPRNQPQFQDLEKPMKNDKPAIENAPEPSSVNPPPLKNYKT